MTIHKTYLQRSKLCLNRREREIEGGEGESGRELRREEGGEREKDRRKKKMKGKIRRKRRQN